MYRHILYDWQEIRKETLKQDAAIWKFIEKETKNISYTNLYEY